MNDDIARALINQFPCLNSYPELRILYRPDGTEFFDLGGVLYGEILEHPHLVITEVTHVLDASHVNLLSTKLAKMQEYYEKCTRADEWFAAAACAVKDGKEKEYNEARETRLHGKFVSTILTFLRYFEAASKGQHVKCFLGGSLADDSVQSAIIQEGFGVVLPSGSSFAVRSPISDSY